MTHTIRIGMLAATLVACGGLLAAPVASAGEKVINSRYAGVGYDTAVDTNGDGLRVGITHADWQGTFGQAQLAITTEWFVFPRACRDGYDVPLALVNSAAIATFADQSQLFAFSQNGWLCLSSSTGAYYGEVYGIYNGGTGRFTDATGTYTTKFEGQGLDPTIGFRSIRATVEGRLTNP
jgi:hypothetical protein